MGPGSASRFCTTAYGADLTPVGPTWQLGPGSASCFRPTAYEADLQPMSPLDLTSVRMEWSRADACSRTTALRDGRRRGAPLAKRRGTRSIQVTFTRYSFDACAEGVYSPCCLRGGVTSQWRTHALTETLHERCAIRPQCYLLADTYTVERGCHIRSGG